MSHKPGLISPTGRKEKWSKNSINRWGGGGSFLGAILCYFPRVASVQLPIDL